MTKCDVNALHLIYQTPGFYKSEVTPVVGARDAIYSILAMGHRVVYVTSCPTSTFDQKREWLLRYGFLTDQNVRRDYIAAHDKALIRADFLFDDGNHNIQTFPGIGVLVTRPHNASARPVFRISSMAEAPALLRRLNLH